MALDDQLRPWSTMGGDLDAWIRREIAQERGPTRAICLAGDDRGLPELASDAVRCAAVRDDDRPAGELSYWVLPDALGRGLAHAAVRTLLRSVVPGLVLRSVVLDIEAGNLASMRVAERLGAKRSGPSRVEGDRTGMPRTLVVQALGVEP